MALISNIDEMTGFSAAWLKREPSTGFCQQPHDLDLGDPDITGFGVLISFFFSIVLVIVVIVWAYFRDALPKRCYNVFDNFILNRKVRSEDGERVHNMRSFILSLSDQQLVSGLALVISINIIRNGVQNLDKKISAYAYNNAVILAFFSCIIHLATISVLCDYFQDRHFLKHVRVALMTIVIVLLLQALAESWTPNSFLPLRCAIEEWRFLQDLSGEDELIQRLGNPATVFGFVILLGILTTGYIRRFYQLYVYDFRDFPARWQKALLEKTIGWPASSKDEVIAARHRLASRLSNETLDIRGLAQIFFLVLPGSFNESFMFEVVWIIFYFVFGIAQVSFYLQQADGGGKNAGINFEPRFGQLLPIVLISLPFLAMVEGYSDIRKGKNHGTPPENDAIWVTEQMSEENEEDIEFILASEAHPFLMKIASWVFAVSYLLIWIFVSLAVGQNFPVKTSWGSIAVILLVAFITCGFGLTAFAAQVLPSVTEQSCSTIPLHTGTPPKCNVVKSNA
ncbi:hypothetical protein F5Y14DRAFT_461542 [Nemania sp. NC0429]|nr:hypothetical protein F5Y14DRAFT_461542 [Nemania sp. NC0429]